MARLALIEDEAWIAKPLERMLAAEGYEVSTYSHGKSALQGIATAATEIVLLDLRLPDIDGFEVLRCLRQASKVPVIVLTAQDDETAAALALKMGADDYIRKPFRRVEGLARIEAALRRASAAAAAMPQSARVHGTLIVDQVQHSCLWNNAAVTLTRTQLEFLWHLMHEPARPKSREELQRACLIEHIDGVIRDLRDTFGPEAIVNIHGVGYKIGDQFLNSGREPSL